LLSNLQKVLPGSAVIVISHGLSAMFCLERVILLEAGRIVEDASPQYF
jgi:ABC-type bacteriocin/lantibiotic exporter with double-glycine peptidase domain